MPPSKVEERSRGYELRISELEASLARQSPNMKAGAQLEEVDRKLKEQA